jgi:hypothetical protein
MPTAPTPDSDQSDAPLPATPGQVPGTPSLQHLLDRPDLERAREHRYRCAQAIVFGLPVIALQFYGGALAGSPDEAQRWTALLQALLTTWVIYTGASGLLIDGIMLLRRGMRGDLIVAAAGLLMYLWSLGSVLGMTVTGRLAWQPLLFHVVVLLIALWCGIQWYRWSRRALMASPAAPRSDKPLPHPLQKAAAESPAHPADRSPEAAADTPPPADQRSAPSPDANTPPP